MIEALFGALILLPVDVRICGNTNIYYLFRRISKYADQGMFSLFKIRFSLESTKSTKQLTFSTKQPFAYSLSRTVACNMKWEGF